MLKDGAKMLVDNNNLKQAGTMVREDTPGARRMP